MGSGFGHWPVRGVPPTRPPTGASAAARAGARPPSTRRLQTAQHRRTGHRQAPPAPRRGHQIRQTRLRLARHHRRRLHQDLAPRPSPMIYRTGSRDHLPYDDQRVVRGCSDQGVPSMNRCGWRPSTCDLVGALIWVGLSGQYSPSRDSNQANVWAGWPQPGRRQLQEAPGGLAVPRVDGPWNPGPV